MFFPILIFFSFLFFSTYLPFLVYISFSTSVSLILTFFHHFSLVSLNFPFLYLFPIFLFHSKLLSLYPVFIYYSSPFLPFSLSFPYFLYLFSVSPFPHLILLISPASPTVFLHSPSSILLPLPSFFLIFLLHLPSLVFSHKDICGQY